VWSGLLAARIVDESFFGMEVEASYFRLRLRFDLIRTALQIRALLNFRV